nr:hypothetical protein [Methylobacterium sp. ZNC0032]
MAAGIAVHLFNISDASHRYDYNLRTPSPDGLPTKLIGAVNGNTADQIIAAVVKVAEGQKIKAMRILAHGNAGQLAFPQMDDEYTISSKFKALRSYFGPMARIEIHGCGVASETDIMRPGVDYRQARRTSDFKPGTFTGKNGGAGLSYLRRFASILNARVTGAVDVQHFDEQWSYEGRTVTVEPNGKFVLESEAMRDWDIAATERSAAAFWDRIQSDFIRYKAYVQARANMRDLVKRFPHTQTALIVEPLIAPGRLENQIVTSFE